MQESRERKIKNTKGPTLVNAKGNAASDIAWRRISARARNRAEIFEGTKGYTAKYQDSAAISSLRRKSLSLTTLETETHAPKRKKSRKVEQEHDFPFK